MSIHVTHGKISSFYCWVVFQCVCMYVYHIYFIHSSINGHLDCFHMLAIVHNATMNIVEHIYFSLVFLYSLDKYPEEGLLDYYFSSALNFLSNHRNFSSSGKVTFLPTVYEGSIFSTSLPTLVIFCLFDITTLTGMRWYCIVIPICVSLKVSDVEHLSTGQLVISKYIFFGKKSTHFLYSFFFFFFSLLLINLFIGYGTQLKRS